MAKSKGRNRINLALNDGVFKKLEFLVNKYGIPRTSVINMAISEKYEQVMAMEFMQNPTIMELIEKAKLID